jgi:hypothetical protein
MRATASQLFFIEENSFTGLELSKANATRKRGAPPTANVLNRQQLPETVKKGS